MRFNAHSIIVRLIGINIVVYLLQLFIPTITSWFALRGSGGFQAWYPGAALIEQPWTIFTHMFLHSPVDPFHLLINMLVLFMFGSLLVSRIGQKRFLYIYLVSGIIAGIVGSFIYPSALGASAAINGIIGVIIVLLPRLPVLFFGIIPMPLWVAGLLFSAYDFFISVTGLTNVGGYAHIVGLICGLFYGFYLKKKHKVYDPFFSRKTSSKTEEDIDEYLRTGRI
jgi:membrane associated rhomboid family serine protease